MKTRIVAAVVMGLGVAGFLALANEITASKEVRLEKSSPGDLLYVFAPDGQKVGIIKYQLGSPARIVFSILDGQKRILEDVEIDVEGGLRGRTVHRYLKKGVDEVLLYDSNSALHRRVVWSEGADGKPHMEEYDPNGKLLSTFP
jgi:hypothetical protein